MVDTPGGGHLLLLAEPGGDRIQTRLMLGTEPGRARAHLARPRKPPRPSPPESSFSRDATRLLRDRRVLAIGSIPGDRVTSIRLVDEQGRATTLFAELFGATPNLILVDDDGAIVALKRKRGGSRPLHLGGRYEPPAARDVSPDDTDPEPPAPDDDFSRAHPWSGAVDRVYFDLDRRAVFQQLQQQLRARVGRDLDKAERLVENLIRQRDDGREAALLRHRGDLLSANFHRLRAGMRKIEVDDYDTGAAVTIDLDPALPPAANVERLYRRARKQERSGEGALKRLCDTRRRVWALRDLRRRIEECQKDVPDALRDEVESHCPADSSTGPAPPAELKKVDPEHRKGLRTFRLRSGVLALVGKSNRDNDYLTQQVARGNDLWMHLQGDSGSHVVLRLPKGRPASPEDLEDAAALAVHYSRRRGAAAADVMYTPKKYVRKPKGSPAGAVTVDRFKTFHHRHQPERLAALLGGED